MKKITKFSFILGVLSLLLIEFDSNKVAAATSEIFNDVPKTHVYHDVISDMASKGIISGYADGSFKPNEYINRQHAAVLINNAVTLPVTSPTKHFKDIPTDHPYFEAIQSLQKANLIHSDTNGNFNPKQALTRGEMAQIIATAYDLEVKSNETFSDVKGTEFEKYVKALYSNGVTAGYEDGTFKPDAPLTRAHYTLFMYRANNLDSSFVPEPIEEVSEVEKSKVEIADLYRFEVPLPKGVASASDLLETQTAKQKELAISQRHTTWRTFTPQERYYESVNRTLEEKLETESKHMRISYEELVKIINQVVKTGEVYNGGHYTIFYSFDEGLIKTSIQDTTFVK